MTTNAGDRLMPPVDVLLLEFQVAFSYNIAQPLQCTRTRPPPAIASSMNVFALQSQLQYYHY